MLAAGSLLCGLSLGTAAAGIAAATETESGCRGTVIVNLNHTGAGHPSGNTVHHLGTTLVAGTYEAMALEVHQSSSSSEHESESEYGSSNNSEGSGSEGSSSSESEEEPSEYWEVRFLDSTHNVVGETTLMLLHDHQPVVELGNIVLSGAAVKVSLSEIKENESEDLHHAVCLGLTRLVPPTTTTTTGHATTSTTTASTTTASTATTSASTTSTTAAKFTSEATTTTEDPTTVAGNLRSQTLPVTGSDTALLMVVGAASMMLGTSLILGARRREA